MDLKQTIVIDEVIPEDLQNQYHDLIMNYPHWKFVKDMSYAENNLPHPSYGLNATFKHPDHGIISELYEAVSVPICNAIIKQINYDLHDIYFNRAFLQFPLDPKFIKDHNGVHVDIDREHYACVYYLNDSDGDTIIYEQTIDNTVAGSKNVKLVEHKRVTPKKGRVVLFDGKRYHCSSQPRNGYRAIINFDLI